MKTERDYEDFDGRVIGFAAIACSVFTIAACLFVLPMVHNQMGVWQINAEAQLRDVRVSHSAKKKRGHILRPPLLLAGHVGRLVERHDEDQGGAVV